VLSAKSFSCLAEIAKTNGNTAENRRNDEIDYNIFAISLDISVYSLAVSHWHENCLF